MNNMDLLFDDIVAGNSVEVPYVILGDNSVGKTAILSRLIHRVLDKRIPVAHMDVNFLSDDMKNRYGKVWPVEPAYFLVAYRAKLVVLDEIGGVVGKNNTTRVGTQERIKNLLDKSKNNGVPVVMAFAGSEKKYEGLVNRLMNGGVDVNGRPYNRDLGSRLDGASILEIGKLSEDGRHQFLKDSLSVQGFLNDEYANMVATGVDERLPYGASMRRMGGLFLLFFVMLMVIGDLLQRRFLRKLLVVGRKGFCLEILVLMDS